MVDEATRLGTDPDYLCKRCPRLVDFIAEYKKTEPDWYNGPVATFGDPNARLLVIGLAPGLRGANRTGRPFTGDYAGGLLYDTLAKFGYTQGTYDKHKDDGLTLQDVAITNAVRCVPPQNKPTGDEIKQCRPFLHNTLNANTNLKALLVLGRIAHETVLRSFDHRLKDFPFSHASAHHLPNGLVMFDSYHCSRYNTNTGRLTPTMFETVFEKIAITLNR